MATTDAARVVTAGTVTIISKGTAASSTTSTTTTIEVNDKW